MKKQSGAGNVLDSIMKFVGNIVNKIKKADKRMLLMVAAAIVLIIIILSLIIHGISAGKDKKEVPSGSSAGVGSVLTDRTTNDNAANAATPEANAAGKYKVATGSETPLNMRIAADSSSERITTIPNGTELQVLFVDDSKATNPGDYGWGYVEYKGDRGWVSMEFLKAEQ